MKDNRKKQSKTKDIKQSKKKKTEQKGIKRNKKSKIKTIKDTYLKQNK